MQSYVVTRAESSGRRIVEAVHVDSGDAYLEKDVILKRYANRHDLCSDVEVDVIQVGVSVLVKTTLADGMPSTILVAKGSHAHCVSELRAVWQENGWGDLPTLKDGYGVHTEGGVTYRYDLLDM